MQRKWQLVEKQYHYYAYKLQMSSNEFSAAEIERFRLIDKQLQLLLRATCKNANVLLCCQRKSTLSFWSHFSLALSITNSYQLINPIMNFCVPPLLLNRYGGSARSITARTARVSILPFPWWKFLYEEIKRNVAPIALPLRC